MDCVRCGGLWFESGENSYCINCGNCTMPGHPHCSLGDTLTDADHKRARTMRFGKAFQAIGQPKAKQSNLGRPTKAKKIEQLKNYSQNVPLEEHPYILFMAELWEDVEASIDVLKRKQDDLRMACHTFSESYSEIKVNDKI